jgi:hypothetical protein
VSAEDRPRSGRGDWVTLADGVRISRTGMTRYTPRLLAAWCDATSAEERRAVGARILQIAGALESAPDDRGREPSHRTWEVLVEGIDPRLVDGPDWPPLAAALHRAASVGYAVVHRLPALARAAPLPDRHPARELHWRLLDDCPAAVPRRSAAEGPTTARRSVPESVHSSTSPPQAPPCVMASPADGGASTPHPRNDEGDTA